LNVSPSREGTPSVERVSNDRRVEPERVCRVYPELMGPPCDRREIDESIFIELIDRCPTCETLSAMERVDEL